MSKEVQPVLVVQISDLHIRDADSPAILKVGQLAGAVGSLRMEATNLVLLVTGDIAYSGASQQYEIALQALTDLRQRLLDEWMFESVEICICPGNHDCDFTRVSDAVRDALLAGLGSDVTNQTQIIESLSGAQVAYEDFANSVAHPRTRVSPVLSVYHLEIGGRTINVLALNTSWSSRLDERPGSLRMPAESLLPLTLDQELSIAILHHPLNWYSPQDGKALSDWLDAHADMAFWGHEHRADDFAVSRRRFGSSVAHYLAMPIDDKSSQCGFRAIILSADNKIDVRSFEWRNVKFENARGYVESLPKNPARALGQVRFSREFKLFLQDPGASFKHDRLDRPLSLTDIFIEPAFKAFSNSSDVAEKLDFSVPLTDVCDNLRTVTDMGVFAPEQAGKTTFAKYLIEDARHNGLTALYFDAAKLKGANRGVVTSWIKSSISFQFERDCIPSVEQLEPGNVLVVIDNAHQLPGNAATVREIVQRLKLHGSKIVYLTAQNPAITFLAANKVSGEEIKIWSDAKWYELLPLNNKRRGELIRRWASLGRDEHIEHEQIEVEVRKTKILIDGVLGRNFMPKYPFFLLVLLQQVELAKDAGAINNGSQGHVFEALITTSLEASLRSHEIGVAEDFLSKLAFHLWTNAERDVSINGFEELIGEFRREALVDLSHPELLNDLVSARVLYYEGDLISFRYNYFYYYYVARWLAGHRGGDGSAKALDHFIDNIHTEMSANVVMFVAHLGHQGWVLEKLLPAAEGLFGDVAPCVLINHATLAAKYSGEQREIVLLTGHASDISDHRHSQEDEVGYGDGGELMEDAFRFNTAIRMIQTLGQILRSRAGSITGDEKVVISTTAIALARRLMSKLYDVAEMSAQSLIENVSELFETEVKIDSKEAAHLASRLLAAVIGGIAKSIVTRCADVFGTRDLIPLIERLEELYQGDKFVDNQLVLLVARVSAEKKYPRERVESMLKKMKDADILAHAALAHAVARSFYLNPPPRAIRDSACSRLGITVKTLPKLPQGGNRDGRALAKT